MYGFKGNKCKQIVQAFKQTVSRTIPAGGSAYSFIVPTDDALKPFAAVNVVPIVPEGFDPEEISVKVFYIENDPDGPGVAKAIITNDSDTAISSIDLLVSFIQLGDQ